MIATATRSNPISQRVMKPLEVDVFGAARERMRHIFATYDRVVVSYSGGKDSTCCLEITIEVARELRDGMESSRLSLADRQRLLRMCDTAKEELRPKREERG